MEAEIKVLAPLHSAAGHSSAARVTISSGHRERRHRVAVRASYSPLPAVQSPQSGLGDSAGGGKGLGAMFVLAQDQA